MKRLLILLCLVSLSFADNTINVTKENAINQGKMIGDVLNMKYEATYNEKISDCKTLSEARALMGANNRAEMLPYVVQSCSEAIKK